MKKSKSLLQATVFVSVLTLLGKFLGFWREALIADFYGATWETDAFFLAQSMPAMIFPAVCNSVSTAFLSLYVKRTTDNGEREGDLYGSRMLTAAFVLGIFLAGIGIVLAPAIVPLFAPGFSQRQTLLATSLTQLTMGAFFLTMLQYMMTAILNAKRLFVAPQVAAFGHNLTIIALTLILGRGQSMEQLTATVIAGSALQTLALVLFCRGRFHFRLKNPVHEDTGILIRFALPILFGNSVIQINNIVDKALGSTLPEGCLSALSYSSTLTMLVTNIFITTLSTVLYPTLTTDAAEGNLERYSTTLIQSLSGLTALLLPISCITMLTAEDVVMAVYGRGSFDQTAVTYTAVALVGYAPMFVGAGIREVLNRGFYAIQDTKTPMITGAVGVGCNIIFSFLFVRYLGLVGISLGTSLAAFVSAALLLWKTRKVLPTLRLSDFFHHFGKQILSGGVLLVILIAFRWLWPISHPLLQFVVNTLVSFAVYCGMLLILDRGLFTNLLVRDRHS